MNDVRRFRFARTAVFFLIALLNIRLSKNLIEKNYSKKLARLNIACYHYSKFIF
ncbi:hypothetical protein HMPREF9193_00556 [Treponema lecithinolyticum ATCC 700332]|uniref:Uncharacterized protein n=1 Tax=Treponema lecithinolyticum ATCC 700332 TaxID=1321815 RepID=A0ABN0P0D1_TRELE|nr:hypothetical protein HMPREF9193_00556 [Treponema lecithinolyticum ATCC 700332]